MPTTTRLTETLLLLDGHAAVAGAGGEPATTERKRAPEATVHGYTNDLTWALCAALRSESKAHALVQEWFQRPRTSSDAVASFNGTDAKAIFTPRVLGRLKIRVNDMPDGEVDWDEVAEEFGELGLEDAPIASHFENAPAPLTEVEEVPAAPVAPDAMEVLRQCWADERAVYLPPAQLDPRLYKKVSAVLEALGGKWNRASRGHVFADDPREVLEVVQATGTYVNPRDFGFFRTPQSRARHVVGLAKLEPGMRVLEPEAGDGALADEAAAIVGVDNVQTVEFLARNAAVLASKGYAVRHGDFLAMTPVAEFDRVIMNPPFAAQADMRHVEHAARFLKADGQLVAIMSPSFQFRSTKVATAFRALVDAAGVHQEEMEAGAFRESGTDVRTVIVVLDAARLPWNLQHSDLARETDEPDEVEQPSPSRVRERVA